MTFYQWLPRFSTSTWPDGSRAHSTFCVSYRHDNLLNHIYFRFDCCSKAFLVTGSIWNHLTTICAPPECPLPSAALKRLKLHHRSLISLTIKTAQDVEWAQQFLPQLEHLTLNISAATTFRAPEIIQKLDNNRFTSFSIHCWDYTDRTTVLASLPRILPNLRRLKLISEPTDDLAFLNLIKTHCNRLEALQFESERRGGSQEVISILQDISASNRATLKFLDIHFIAGTWVALLPGNFPMSIAAANDGTGWTPQALSSDCLTKYGVPFERFGTNSSYSFRNRHIDLFGSLLDSSVFSVAQLEMVLSLYKAYYPDELLTRRYLTAASSLKFIYQALKLAAKRLKEHEVDSFNSLAKRVVELVKSFASMAITTRQIRKVLGLLLEGVRNEELRLFLVNLLATLPAELKDCLLIKAIKTHDRLTREYVFCDSDLMQELQIDFSRVLTLRIDSESYTESLGSLLAIHASLLIPKLLQTASFDPWSLRTASGQILFDAIFDAFCATPTHASKFHAETIFCLLEYSLEQSKITLQDIEKLCSRLFASCVPPQGSATASDSSYILRLDFVRCFFTLIPENKLIEHLENHYKSVYGVSLHPDDLEPFQNDIFIRGRMFIALSNVLWRNLLRNIGREETLAERLELIRHHESTYPDFVDDFLEEKSPFPIPGILMEEQEAAQIRSKLKSAILQARLFRPFKFSMIQSFQPSS